MTTKLFTAGAKTRRRILVVDDHPMTRYGIVQLIEQEPDLVVCGEAQDASGAFAGLEEHKPDLILADLTMPGGEGLEFIKNTTAMHPEVAVLVLSMHDEMIYAERALRAGARGYLMKSEGGEKLVGAIRQVLEGKKYLSENMSRRILEVFSGRCRDNSVLGNLTEREFEVFGLLGRGLTSREISRQLHLGVKTIETHRLHIREKLHIKTGPALIKYAVHWAGTQNLL